MDIPVRAVLTIPLKGEGISDYTPVIFTPECVR